MDLSSKLRADRYRKEIIREISGLDKRSLFPEVKKKTIWTRIREVLGF